MPKKPDETMDVSDVESQEPVIEKVSVSELVAAHLKALHSMETSDHALQRATERGYTVYPMRVAARHPDYLPLPTL